MTGSAEPVMRAVRAGDVPAIRHVAEAAWEAAYRDIILPENRRQMVANYYSDEELTRELSRNDAWFWVIEQDGSVVAFAQLVLKSGGRGYVTRIYVLPDAQRQGLGMRLFQEALRTLQTQGAQGITVSVEKRNAGAVAFYEKIGLKPMGEYQSPLPGQTLTLVEYSAHLSDLGLGARQALDHQPSPQPAEGQRE